MYCDPGPERAGIVFGRKAWKMGQNVCVHTTRNNQMSIVREQNTVLMVKGCYPQKIFNFFIKNSEKSIDKWEVIFYYK